MATRKKKVREATCTYGSHGAVASKPTLAFFKDRRAGSPYALNTCGVCNYGPAAHEKPVPKHLEGRTNDHDFIPSIGRDTDEYYCGCYGWD